MHPIPTEIFLGLSKVKSTETFPVFDPATGKVLMDVANATSTIWKHGLEIAIPAGKQWSTWAPRKRSEVLTTIFHAINRHADDLARIITLEMGKPLAQSQAEVSYGAEYFRWFAEEAVRLPGRVSHSPSGAGTITVTRTPVGPVLAITPWNFPLAMAARKIAPALAAGCPILVKPASETPLTLLRLAEVMNQVFLDYEVPDGLVSVIPTTYSTKLSQELMADPRLRKVTFTGSTGTGKLLVRQSADNLQRTSMELGGNAPFVVAADADLDLVVSCAAQAKMRNGGQTCIAANRFYVHESLADDFTQRLTKLMKNYVTGHGMDEKTTLGPMINEHQRNRVHTLVTEAVATGATLQLGGEIPEGPGYFYPATVLTDVPADAQINQEEIFGPVATITTFTTLNEGITLANDTPFGLAAYGFSENTHLAHRLARELDAGMVGINRAAISDPAAPFGGIGLSGFGREGGSEGIEDYLDMKYIATPSR